MSEDEMRKGEAEEPQDEVEGHLRRGVGQNDEGQTEGDDDDFEAHRHNLKA